MTLGVYSNNFIPREKYAIKDSTNSGSMDKEGQNSFLEEFAKDEASEKRLKSDLEREEKQVEDVNIGNYTIPSHSTISDYIDNFFFFFS